jgi:hypothetical protein
MAEMGRNWPFIGITSVRVTCEDGYPLFIASNGKTYAMRPLELLLATDRKLEGIGGYDQLRLIEKSAPQDWDTVEGSVRRRSVRDHTDPGIIRAYDRIRKRGEELCAASWQPLP